MTAWLQWLDASAHDWGAILWRASWQGALAIALAWGIVRFTSLAAPRVQCWIWRLVCLKLLVALVWLTPIGLPLLPAKAPPAPPQAAEPRAAMQRPNWEAIAADPLPDKPAAAAVAESVEPHRSIGILAIVMLLWSVGVVYQVACTLREWMAAARFRRAAPPLGDGQLQRLLAEEAQRLGVARPPELRQSSEGTSPLLTGIWRPAIVLPESIARGFNAADLRLMLAHELAHMKRRDLLWNWLPTVVGWLYFFHPLAWLLRRHWSAAQEAACDELVLQRHCAPASEYGRMLVKLAAGCPSEPRTTLAAAGVLGGYRRLEERIESLSRVTAPSWKRLGLAATAIALLAAAGIVPWRLVAQELPPNTFQAAQPIDEPNTKQADDSHTATLNLQPITGTFQPQQRIAPKPPSEAHQDASAELTKLGAQVVPGTKGGWLVVAVDEWTGGDQGLELLAKLDGVEQLVLNCEKLSDQALAVLKNKPIADLQLIQANDQQLDALRGNESIATLTLLGRRMTDAGLKTIGTLSNLESFHLSSGWNDPGAADAQITSAGIAELARCKKLRRLAIDTVPGSTVSKLGQLADLPELESLWLMNIGLEDGGLAEAAKLRQLRMLIVSGKQISSAGYAPLASLDRLEHLSINAAANFDDAAAACLEDMRNLSRLDLFESRITDAGLAHVAGLERLQQINIWQGEIGDAGLVHLKELKNLRGLTLSGENVHISGRGLQHLTGLTRLERLSVPCKDITDDALKALGNLKALESLHLAGSQVRGPGLDALAGLPKLKVLDLSGTLIADAELGRLAKFSALEALTLDDTAVTDQGLKTVAQLPHLKLLNLRNVEITDAGLDALAPLTMLRQLQLSSEKVTQEGIARLKTKLPKLRIENSDMVGLSLKYVFELDADSELELEQQAEEK